MEALLWAPVAVMGGLAFLPLAAALRFRRYVHRSLMARPAPYTPRLSVIMPCKGVDPGFRENLRSLMEQDYPDFELIFVTAARDDPARTVLEETVAEYPHRACRLLAAGTAAGRSEKLNNLLFACGQVRPESEALVFVDSDVRAHPRFLRDLVAPLREEGVGATTGFRWYIPEAGGLGSYLRATWNGGGLPMLAHPKLAYAWGGATAILRRTFERTGVPRRWRHALTDDFPLTEAVRSAGLEVRFVPQCLVTSHEDSSLGEVVEWTNRQTVICRVYNPRLWRGIFFIHAAHALGLTLAAAMILVKVLVPGAGFSVWPALAMLGSLPLEAGSGMLLWQAVRKLRPEVGGWWRALKHAALVPVAIGLIFYNSVHSLLTRDIRWRGVRYRLHSPDHTEVLT